MLGLLLYIYIYTCVCVCVWQTIVENHLGTLLPLPLISPWHCNNGPPCILQRLDANY